MCDFDDHEDLDGSEFKDEYGHNETDTDETASQEDESTIHPFLIGSAMGFAYEEGLRERTWRKRKRDREDFE